MQGRIVRIRSHPVRSLTGGTPGSLVCFLLLHPDVMKKQLTNRTRRLEIRRETVRRLTALDPLELAQVAGGWKTSTCPRGADTFGKTSTVC